MEEALLDPLLAFSWLTSELLGRAVSSSCKHFISASTSANPMYKIVTLEIAQSTQQTGQIMLKVSDEGDGLPDSLKSYQQIFAPLQYPLASSCVVQDAGLLLRTTTLQESFTRRYQISNSSDSTAPSNSRKLDIIKFPLEEEKLPGLQFSGTQATLFFSSLAVPPDAALAACQQLLSMLSTLCPPVHLIFKAQDLLLAFESSDESVDLPQQQQGESQQTATASHVTPRTTFTQQLEPLPSTALLTPMQRLKSGLLEEFSSTSSSNPPMPLSSQQSQQQTLPSPPPLLSFVGVGEGAVPRGCKWTAYAGVVLHLPDHNSLASAIDPAQQYPQQYQSSPGEASENQVVEPSQQQQQSIGDVRTTVHLFKSYAVQFAENNNYIDALRRVNWSAHGFKLLDTNPSAAAMTTEGGVEEQKASLEPVAVVLRCEQPESMAHIATIVVHLYYLTTSTSVANANASSSQGRGEQQHQQQPMGGSGILTPPPKLAPLHQRTLIRTAIEAALADLKQQCPSVISDRRDRSLMKALPVVSTAVAGILQRAVGEGVLVEASQALRVREVGSLADALYTKLEEVVISAQQQQRRGEEQGGRGG